MIEIKVRMVIDPFRTEGNVLSCAKKLKLSQTMVSVGYEDEAGILYVKFKHAEIVDNDLLTIKGLSLRL